MSWLPDKSRPICPQICEHLCLEIAQGVYAPEERLPSVRELATALRVNPNTVQHAMERLDSQEVIYAVRGSGWYVREDISVAREMLQRIRQQKVADFFEAMQVLGLSTAQTKRFVEEWYHE